jgi:hypothetical protein
MIESPEKERKEKKEELNNSTPHYLYKRDSGK